MILNLILAIVTIGGLYLFWKEPDDENAFLMVFSVGPGTWLAGRLGIKPFIGALVLIAINVTIIIINKNGSKKSASANGNSVSATSAKVSSRSSQTHRQTDVCIDEKNRYIIDNAIAFAGLCSKLDGMKGYPIYFELRTDNNGFVSVYATHTVHNNVLLEHAHNRALEGDREGVEYAYNQLIATHGLTSTELRSFQDVSDFTEFLRGGIPNYNTCKCTGISNIEITQILGTLVSNEKYTILSDIEKSVVSSFRSAKLSFSSTSSIGILV